ncbi:MAG: hypothetical protein SFU87_20880 [Chitinophagaceae bacterium]|nr:hypothetical protein [Chitinophagaceae bacterium]
MKKQIILPLLLILNFTSWSQKSITTVERCTDAMAMQAKGKWIKTTHESASSSKEINNILDEFHNMVMKIYPQPTGVDAAWHSVEGISYFGAKQKTSAYTDGRPKYEDTELPHFRMYYYRCGFFRYSCEYNKTHTMLPGYPGETGTWLTISANNRQPAISEVIDGSWTINGMGVRLLNPGARTYSGLGLRDAEKGRNYRIVLIHRKDILPYIPVTRKQYLERCIIYHTKLWDETVKRTENLPVRSLEEQEKEKNAKLAKFEKDFGKDPKRLKSAVDYYLSGYNTDQQMRDEQVQKAKKNKEQELKKFTDEVEKTTRQGLLDSPAMIREMYNSDLIFDTDPLQANMVVIENRDYIRKDLPKHVPQFFVVDWEWSDWAPQEKIDEIMEKDFPYEKLQAMIDK